MRKNEIKRTIKVLQERNPQASPKEIASRVINAKTGLSLLGGSLLHIPAMMPGVGQALKLAGVVGAGSMLTRMHLYMILEVALAYGHDVDDMARVPEMAAVVATTGLGAAASPLIISRLNLNPSYTAPIGALSMVALTRLVGLTASMYYGAKQAPARALTVA